MQKTEDEMVTVRKTVSVLNNGGETARDGYEGKSGPRKRSR